MGTLVNCIAVIAGGFTGLIFKNLSIRAGCVIINFKRVNV